MSDVIIGFNKSLSKNLINIGGENPAKAAPHLIESIIIDNRFPPQNIDQKNISQSTPSSLNRIQIEVSSGNIQINDEFLWDENDVIQENLQQFASIFVKDSLEEQKINADQNTTQSINFYSL